MNENRDKTKEQLLTELEELRDRSRKREEALKESELRLKSLINETPDIICFKDGQGRWLIANDADLDLFNLKNVDYVGKTDAELAELTDPIFKKSFLSCLETDEKAWQSKGLSRGEEAIPAIDGTKKTFDVIKVPLFESDGARKGLVVLGRDITELKYTEKILKEKERFLKTIFDGIQEPMHVIDRDYKVLLTNRKLLEMEHVKQEDICGKYCYEVYRGLNKHCKQCGAKEVFKTGKPCSLIQSLPLPDGTDGYFEVYSFPLFEENGEVTQVIEMARDITERRRAEEALKKEKNFSGKIVETAKAIIIGLDKDHVIRIFNQGAEQITGYKKGEVIGKDWFKIFFPKEILNEMNKVWKDSWGVKSHSYINPILSKTGEEKIVSWQTTGMYDSDDVSKHLLLSIGEDITERKRAEEALKKNEKKSRELSTLLRLMTDNLPDMLWAKNLNNEYIFVNKAICTGLLNAKDTDEPLGKTDMFFAARERDAHPDNPEWHTFGELCRDTDTATLEAMKPMHFDEFGNVRGKFLFLDVHKAPLYDSDGQLIGTVGSARDVTVAKEAENQLLKLSTAVTQSPSVIAITDTKGNLEYANPKFTELTGYSSEEAIGQNPRVLKSGEMDDEIYKELWETISSGKIWRGEFHNKKKNGELFWEMASVSPIFDEQGKIINYIKVAEDITQRKRAEDELAAEKERLDVTLRSIGDGVITTDVEGKIVLINQAAENLTGWSNEDARGKPVHEVFTIVNEKTGQKCASPVPRVLEFGRIIGLANHTALITKKGNQVSIADSGAPIRDAESRIIGVIIVFRDVTHERQLEENLLRTKKLESVGVLAGGIAHDFNNILAAILGNIELASLRIEDDNVSSLLSSAQKATQRATKLTRQLLTFSKGGNPVKETTSLSGLIQESADFVLHGSRVRCEYSLPDDLWMVDADSGQIGQVIQNIIINAMHAMPEGGKIQINCSNIEDAAAESFLNIHDGHFVCIRIQDTGIGIPKEIIDKIFDPYYTTKQQGSGLGLAICHSIINKHDGHISVQSTPGKGTTFTIYLPAVSPGGTTAPDVPHTDSAVKAARIMVMDDEEMVRNLVKAQLTRLGHETVLVADGEQAIHEYQKLQDSGMPVDLVIMDLTIPGGMGGQEAAQRLLQIDPRAKIIVASGYSNDPVVAGYREYGFCAAVAKPFGLAELRKSIESALH